MKKQLFSSILIALILLSCTPTRFDQPDQASQQFISFDKNNLSDISEISYLSGGGDCGEISSIQVVLEKDLVYGYCSISRELIIWNISLKIEEERSVLDIDVDLGVSISKDGSSVLGLSQRIINSNSESEEFIYEVLICVQDDSLKYTSLHLCELGEDEYFEAIRGIHISPNGKFALVYYPFWYELYDLENNEDYYVGLSGDADYYVDIGYMAFHPNSKKLAVSFRDTAICSYGDVQIFQLHGPSFMLYKGYKDKSNQMLQTVKDLEFSPDGKWLANITDDGINVWRINILKTHRLLDFKSANIIAFSSDSELLFIGTNDELVVYNLSAKEIIYKIKTPNIESLSISNGNQILAWGDSSGFIHILGIR